MSHVQFVTGILLFSAKPTILKQYFVIKQLYEIAQVKLVTKEFVCFLYVAATNAASGISAQRRTPTTNSGSGEKDTSTGR